MTHAHEADLPAAARMPALWETAPARLPLTDDPDLPASLELLEKGLAASPDNPDLTAGLDLLDNGLIADPENPEWLVDPPLLTARLVLPVPREPSRQVFRKNPDKAFAQDTVREWITSATLVLAMFAGATCAALVFHDRLSVVVARLEAPLR